MNAIATSQIQQCSGYRRLLAAVEVDEARDGGRSFHNYRGKLGWILDRAEQYAEKTGLSATKILDAWEDRRDYWYMNFYQEYNQPEIKADSVRIFDSTDEMLQATGTQGFRCPYCEHVTTNPYRCNSGAMVELLGSPGQKQPCNWQVCGFFGHLGKGIHVFVKEKMQGENIFMPVAWERSSDSESEANSSGEQE